MSAAVRTEYFHQPRDGAVVFDVGVAWPATRPPVDAPTLVQVVQGIVERKVAA